MPQAQTYQSEFTGSQMDERFRAVATLAEALTVLEQAIAAKYTKPADGIPSTDMDASVQSALALALTSVQSLANYYTKPEVDSIAAAIAATVNATSGEVVASLPTASASTLGKIYYVGPTSGEYERYVTSYDGTTYSWLQIGTTDVDMTQYATKAELSQLDQQLVLSDSFRKNPSDLSYLKNASINTSVSPNVISTGSGYRLYYVFVKRGQTVTVHFTLSSGSCNSGTTTELPALGVAVDNYLSRSSSYSERSLAAETDCYFVMRFSASVTTFYVELSNMGFGGDVKRYVDAGFRNVDKTLHDTELSLTGNGETAVDRDFETIAGRTYDILLPDSEWTVEETEDTSKAAFCVRTKSSGSYTDIASTRVYCSSFETRKKIYSFQASTDISNVFIRADDGQVLRFLIHEHDAPSVVSDFILGKKNEDAINTMRVEMPFRSIFHLNVEAALPVIPSQSLFDIAYAKALGFKAIEANLHKCSDGVYVIKHGGSGGTLGAGLVFAPGSELSVSSKFANVTSTDIRADVTYASTLEKYRGHIPTLAEFCRECSRLGMMPFLRGCTVDALAEARKFLPDDNIIIEWISPSWSRLDFKGIMTVWATGTKDEILATAVSKGRPFYYSWSAANEATAASFEEINNALHAEGYALGTSYLNQNSLQRLLGMGLDVDVPTNRIVPPFFSGNVLNIIGGGDPNLAYQNAVHNAETDVITMQNGGTIKVENELIGRSLSKVNVRIRYNGTLSVKFKGYNQAENLVDYVSDGSQFLNIAAALEKVGTDFLTIEASAATTVYDLAIFASVVM